MKDLNAIADRLDKLSDDITKGDVSDFTMRIPAEPERDADLVLSYAAKTLRESEAMHKADMLALIDEIEGLKDGCSYSIDADDVISLIRERIGGES